MSGRKQVGQEGIRAQDGNGASSAVDRRAAAKQTEGEVNCGLSTSVVKFKVQIHVGRVSRLRSKQRNGQGGGSDRWEVGTTDVFAKGERSGCGKEEGPTLRDFGRKQCLPWPNSFSAKRKDLVYYRNESVGA